MIVYEDKLESYQTKKKRFEADMNSRQLAPRANLMHIAVSSALGIDFTSVNIQPGSTFHVDLSKAYCA